MLKYYLIPKYFSQVFISYAKAANRDYSRRRNLREKQVLLLRALEDYRGWCLADLGI